MAATKSGMSLSLGQPSVCCTDPNCWRNRPNPVRDQLGRCRRLAKGWESLNRNALAFLRLASIRLMLRKLCNPS